MHKSISQKTYVTSLADRITKPHVGHGGLVQLSQEDGNFSYSFCFSAARSKLNKWWASSSFVCVRTFRGFCFVSSLPLCSVVIKDLLVFNPIDRSGGVCVYPYIYETGPTIYKHKGLCNRYVVPIHNSPRALERAVWRNLGHMPGTCRVWSASRTPTDAPAILSDNSPQQSDAYSVVRETDSWSSGYLDFLLIFFLSFYLLDYYQAITWRINWRRLILSHSGNQLATKMRVRMGSEVLCRIIPTPSVGGETRKVRQIRSGYFSLSGLYGLGCRCCCCCGSLLVIHARAAECLTTIRLCLGCVSLEKKKRDVDQKRTTTREEKEKKKCQGTTRLFSW